MAAVDVQGLKDRGSRVLASFSPSQLAILGVLSVVAVVAAVAFLRWVSTPTYQVLLAGLDPKDASAVTAQLETDGVAYELEAGGTTILVPADVLEAERLKVAAAGLPANETEGGWAVFDQQGMTSSSFQQQVAYQRAMEGTLASTLTGIKGVEDATVHLAMPEKSVFTEQQQPTRASVLLTTSSSLDGGAVDAVTRLVASSVPGLAPEDVSVSDDKGNLLSASDTGAGGGEAQAAMEDQLSARATTMLDTLLGDGRSVVRVSAELDTASTSTDSEVYDDSKAAVLKESGSTETYTAPPGTTVDGVVAGVDPLAGQDGATGSGDYRKEQSTTERGVSRTVTSEKDGPGGVKRLTVAVAVDSGAPNVPTQAELRDLVANAVGLDPARGDTIAVTLPAFAPVEAQEEAAPAGGVVGGLSGNASTILGGALLLLVALGFLRTLKKGMSSEVPAEEVSAALVQAGAPAALPAGGALELPAGSTDGRSERDPAALAELVDENTDEVTHLIRGWLASTGGGSGSAR